MAVCAVCSVHCAPPDFIESIHCIFTLEIFIIICLRTYPLFTRNLNEFMHATYSLFQIEMVVTDVAKILLFCQMQVEVQLQLQ